MVQYLNDYALHTFTYVYKESQTKKFGFGKELNCEQY